MTQNKPPMYKSIFSSWPVRILAALFILGTIYLTIQFFKKGYDEGRQLRMEMELRRQSK